MSATPEFPKFQYTSVAHAWRMLNPGADGEPGDYTRFRASHGWVKEVRRELEPFMQDESYVRAKEAYLKSVVEGREKQEAFQKDHPALYKALQDKVLAGQAREWDQEQHEYALFEAVKLANGGKREAAPILHSVYSKAEWDEREKEEAARKKQEDQNKQMEPNKHECPSIGWLERMQARHWNLESFAAGVAVGAVLAVVMMDH